MNEKISALVEEHALEDYKKNISNRFFNVKDFYTHGAKFMFNEIMQAAEKLDPTLSEKLSNIILDQKEIVPKLESCYEGDVKKLSYNIERIKVDRFDLLPHVYYIYRFSNKHFLEDIDNSCEYFGIKHIDFKESVIDYLTTEFKISLENVVFKEDIEKIEK